MTIGYASINSVTGDIKGTVIANVQEGVFITDVTYESNIDADINVSKIINYTGTGMQSVIQLSKTNANSEIKYKLTVYNRSQETLTFKNVVYDTSGLFYDNPNIIFEISGFNIGSDIKPKETKEIYITFKYKNGVIPENTILNLYVNFKFMKNWVTIGEIFDAEGNDPEKLHIGDFVEYDAGTWAQEEIDAIKTGEKTNLQTANGSTSLPNQRFQFGGFIAGSSRNGNATPGSPAYDYVKDKATKQGVTGWRVFDIEGENVTLISAGNPEDYYHPYGSGQSLAYVSEYILTGNINSSWTNGATEAGKYQKRDWSVYVKGKATSATPLTKSRLDTWYSKYTNTPNAETFGVSTFQKIYQEPYIKYQSMVENYSYYWLSAADDSGNEYYVHPNGRYVRSSSGIAFGVRPLVSLRSDVKFTATKTGTKTLHRGNMDTYGGEQTYNVWGIQ